MIKDLSIKIGKWTLMSPKVHPVIPGTLTAIYSKLEVEIFSVYIVGADIKNDSELLNVLSESVRIMLFEKDLRRLGEIEQEFMGYRGLVTWCRKINKGSTEVSADSELNDEEGREAIPAAHSSSDIGGEDPGESVMGDLGAGSLDQFFFGTGQLPNLLKISAAGSALDILEGSTRLLQLFKPVVIYRTGNHGQIDARSPGSLLKRHGYRLFDTTSLEPLNSVPSLLPEYIVAVHETDSPALRDLLSQPDRS